MDINFLSLSTSPSDHECQDGDFAAAVNVINEDGALHPLQQPSTAEKTFSLPAPYDTMQAKYYIHTIDNDDPTQPEVKHYIAKTDTAVLWLDGNEWKTIVTDFHVNSLQFIGRIICLIGDTETRWAFWRGNNEKYKVFTYDDFKYNIEIFDEPVSETVSQWSAVEYTSDLGTDFSGYFNLSGNPGQSGTYIKSTTKEGTAALIDRVTSQINKVIADDETLHGNISFGIAALRLYDGSHIMLSDIFVIGGAMNLNSLTLKFTGGNNCTASVSTTLYLHKDQIKVTMSKLADLSSIVEGVDFYLTSPMFFRKYDKAYSLYTEGATGNIYPWRSAASEKSITLSKLDETEYTNQIDNMSFYHSIFISRKEIVNGDKKYLKAVSETNKSISLADFYRAKYGAKQAYVYNSRLDIGDFSSILDSNTSSKIDYNFSAFPPSIDRTYSGNPYILWNDHKIKEMSRGTTDYRCENVTAYARIRWSNSYGESRVSYVKLNTIHPLPPMLMLPIKDVDSIDIYYYVSSLSSQGRYKYAENIPFHTADFGGLSYFLFHYEIGSGTEAVSTGPAFIEEGAYKDNILFLDTDTNGTLYNKCVSEYNASGSSHTITNRYRSSILVSDSDNPIVFRAANTVTVGNGHVLALAAATNPISLGQAGQTPLYAFTSEGIWPLYVNENNGAFKATQPGPRDVCTNIDSIVPLDNAICFATDQGIMLLSGNETQCISNALRHNTHDITLPNLDKLMKLHDSASTSSLISEYATESTFANFLSTCKSVYDYRNQHLLFIQSNADDNPANRHLVFSLRSKAWSLMEGNFYDTINTYPETKLLCINGNSLDLCSLNNESSATDYYLITRPLKLGAPDVFKRLKVAIVRGDFYRDSDSKSEVGQALYGSNDLRNWFYITSSNDQYLRRHAGTPYKYYSFVLVGTLQPGSSLQGISIEATASLSNKLR